MKLIRPALIALALLLFSLPLFAQASPVPAPKPELRAFWVDGFNDGFHTPTECDTLLARLRGAHCNAVFVQMRKRADAYYVSHYEPWASDDPQHFDALAYLCEKAHEPGMPRIQIHAWVNACAIGGNTNPNSLAKTHPDWLSLSDTGADYDQESTKIDPGNPAAADWTYRVYLDIVRHYDVDGIHLDFIRYGGAGKTVGHWGYNAVSIARYNARYGTSGQPLWNDPRWQAWRREQVTGLVRRIYVGATALKPQLIVSAATICWGDAPKDDAAYDAKSAAYTEVYAPWRDWLREGILDLNCPMTYFNLPKHANRWAEWSEFVKDRQFGRMSALGCGIWLNSIPDSLNMIHSTRQPTPAGHVSAGAVLYSYNATDSVAGKEEDGNAALYQALSQPGLWDTDVALPAMPWKIHPTTGTIQGTLLAGSALRAADGVRVTVANKAKTVSRTVVADGNGVFAIVGLPPGAYHVRYEQQSADMTLAAGQTQALTILRGRENIAPGVTGLSRQREGAQVILPRALVTSGSDRLGGCFYVADGFGKSPVRVEAPGLVPPTVMGDQVAVSGILHHTSGGVVITAGAVRLTGAVIVRFEKSFH